MLVSPVLLYCSDDCSLTFITHLRRLAHRLRRHGKGKWVKGPKDSDPAHLKLCVRVLCKCLQILDRSFYSQIYVLDMRFFSPRHNDEGYEDVRRSCHSLLNA